MTVFHKEYPGEPQFITNRRNRLKKAQASVQRNYNAEINESISMAKRRPENNKGIKYYLNELSETFVCGSPKDTVKVLKEMKEEFKQHRAG